MAAAKKKEAPPEEEEDAKGEAGAVGEGVDLPKKKIAGKKLALIIAILIILICGGGGTAYFMGFFNHDPEPSAEETAAAAKEAEANAAPVYFEMPAILVNLTSTGRRPVYAKVRVQLLLTHEEDRAKVTENQPRIVDSFQTYLRELSPEELQGSAGLLRLREELLVRVNAAVAPVEVKDILFQEILPQ